MPGKPVSEAEARAIIARWGELHDLQAGLSAFIPFIARSTHARTVSHWDARYRPENSPRSRMIKTLIEHDWEFRRDPVTGEAFMQGHKVTKFEYLPGFAPDDTADYDPHLDASLGRRKA
jgi:hypothetical protein